MKVEFSLSLPNHWELRHWSPSAPGLELIPSALLVLRPWTQAEATALTFGVSSSQVADRGTSQPPYLREPIPTINSYLYLYISITITIFISICIYLSVSKSPISCVSLENSNTAGYKILVYK